MQKYPPGVVQTIWTDHNIEAFMAGVIVSKNIFRAVGTLSFCKPKCFGCGCSNQWVSGSSMQLLWWLNDNTAPNRGYLYSRPGVGCYPIGQELDGVKHYICASEEESLVTRGAAQKTYWRWLPQLQLKLLDQQKVDHEPTAWKIILLFEHNVETFRRVGISVGSFPIKMLKWPVH